jgi:hypothetical protein
MIASCLSRGMRGASVRARKVGIVAVMTCALPCARAFQIETGNPDVNLNWDNSVKYSTAFRVKSRSDTLTADINQDDGDRNFKTGLISNRFDLLSEFDLKYKTNLGLRVSGAAWYDSVYRSSNDNNSPGTANNLSVPHNEFNTRTRNLHGGDLELLDGFVFANENIAGLPATLRLGRHTLLYGESLFFGNNGIAGGQSAIDAIKLLSVPNSQFKEIIFPVNQVSGQLQIRENLAVGGYYQLEWRKTRLPSEGSYFSNADILEGSERFLLAPVNPSNGIGPALFRDDDLSPRASGQGGFQVRWRPSGHDVELGLYAIRYHEKLPQLYLIPSAAVVPGVGLVVLDPANFAPNIGKFGRYQLVYPENIKAFGASFSTEVGDANVAGEVSARRNTPLVSDPTIVGVTVPVGSRGDNDNYPLYAVGNSLHAQVSTIYVVPPTRLWKSANFLGEIAWNRRTSITKHPEALAANSSRDAWALRFTFEPTWYQVAPGLDLSAPTGLGYSAHGNSSVVPVFNPGGKEGGDASIGLKGVYLQVWNVGLNFTHYFGSEATAVNSRAQFSFKQSLADRDFVSLSVQRTF